MTDVKYAVETFAQPYISFDNAKNVCLTVTNVLIVAKSKIMKMMVHLFRVRALTLTNC